MAHAEYPCFLALAAGRLEALGRALVEQGRAHEAARAALAQRLDALESGEQVRDAEARATRLAIHNLSIEAGVTAPAIGAR